MRIVFFKRYRRGRYLVKRARAYAHARAYARASGFPWTAKSEANFAADWASADAYYDVRW